MNRSSALVFSVRGGVGHATCWANKCEARGMGFIVFGPTRRCCASNIDDGVQPAIDLLSMAGELGLSCPQLEKLHHRFYESTTISFSSGAVASLHGELLALRNAYRAHREPSLIKERKVRARDRNVFRSTVDRVFQDDAPYKAIEEFRLVCEEALEAKCDVQCEGD